MSVAGVASKYGLKLPAIERAGISAAESRKKLKAIVEINEIESGDMSVVAFGSLARLEWTSGSDLDWTLLIDGEADHRHAETSHRLAALLKAGGFADPGSTKTFGTMAFSHGLVHQIGGSDDSNRNTTQRLLLLLESIPANRPEAYERVIRGVLHRYLENDYRPFRVKVPRFLLNDLHRFWRTMCVDYASKYREQRSEKWGLRNVKLRMSRKLIFAAGMLTCYRCDPALIALESPDLDKAPTVEGLVSFLEGLVRQTPLDLVADAMVRFGDAGSAKLVFESYNEFLEKLDDKTIRERLEKLPHESAATDTGFRDMLNLSAAFEEGLENLFFDSPQLRPLTRTYGVF